MKPTNLFGLFVRRRSILPLVVISALAGMLWTAHSQPVQNTTHVPFEVTALYPVETAPGEYQQVDQARLRSLAQDGWELVSVTTFVLRNEEHGDRDTNPKPVVTQAYPAFFFKRATMIR